MSEPKAIKGRGEAKRLNLSAPQEFWTTPETELVLMAGGCGAGKTGDKFVPDRLLGLSILAACVIHDFRYATATCYADKTRADLEFLDNMLRIINQESFWLFRIPRRHWAMNYYQAVAEFGKPEGIK